VNIGPLAGRRVVTTRHEPGRLDALLANAGADVVHVALIEIHDADGGGLALERAIATLGDADWLVVTSQHGAARVGVAAGAHPGVRLAAVGVRTAEVMSELAGRPVDLVPGGQTAAELLGSFPAPRSVGARLVLAQADVADPALAEGLTAIGFDVLAVTAYRTVGRHPGPRERAAALAADAVAFASGSAARAWVAAFGAEAPATVVAIGPTTARVAREVGLKVTHVAADHDVVGLFDEVTAALASNS
jgi:uroporphyrinogen-III synthase